MDERPASLVALRYTVPAGLRKALGAAVIIMLVVAGWRWWTGASSADPDRTFPVMLSGSLCDDWITRIGQRRSEALQPRGVPDTD